MKNMKTGHSNYTSFKILIFKYVWFTYFVLKKNS